jgi:hypothetical protein
VDSGVEEDDGETKKRVAVAEETQPSTSSSIAKTIERVPNTARPMIKFLCPSEFAGSLIGKGGNIISSLNQITQAIVKVSQNGEFFPSTNDRVVVIQGEAERLYAAIDHVTKILIEAQDAARG